MGTDSRFQPHDVAADRAAVGHLATALEEVTKALEAAKVAGWGNTIRHDMQAAQLLLSCIVGDLA